MSDHEDLLLDFLDWMLSVPPEGKNWEVAEYVVREPTKGVKNYTRYGLVREVRQTPEEIVAEYLQRREARTHGK